MARVITQGASKATATVMENVDMKLKSNRKYSLSEMLHTFTTFEAWQIKTTRDPSTFSSTSCDDKTEEQGEQIEINLVDIKKRLEMEPLIEWKMEALETKLSSAQEDLSMKESEIDALRAKLSALNSILVSKNSELVHMENTLASKDDELKQMKDDLALKTSEIHSLESKLLSVPIKIG
ncbi:6188_t:CDS:2, partial [Acaulospora colombiana]